MENIISEYSIHFDLFLIFYTLLYFTLLYIIPHKYYVYNTLIVLLHDFWCLKAHLIRKHASTL